jgi:hypothetical protein
MSIDLRLAREGFDPDTVAVFAAAFEGAWETLKKSGSPLAADGQATLTRELIAKHIIKMGHQGERDRERLVTSALAHLAVPR